jgi:hypothetical protein
MCATKYAATVAIQPFSDAYAVGVFVNTSKPYTHFILLEFVTDSEAGGTFYAYPRSANG